VAGRLHRLTWEASANLGKGRAVAAQRPDDVSRPSGPRRWTLGFRHSGRGRLLLNWSAWRGGSTGAARQPVLRRGSASPAMSSRPPREFLIIVRRSRRRLRAIRWRRLPRVILVERTAYFWPRVGETLPPGPTRAQTGWSRPNALGCVGTRCLARRLSGGENSIGTTRYSTPR